MQFYEKSQNFKIFVFFWKIWSKNPFIFDNVSKNKKKQKNVQTDSWVLGDSETHEFAWFLLDFCGNFQNFVTDCSRE